ncbi:MAG TPA: GIY-YIG nuclease family protein [bacterium]|nr:GIY-YIG nuclease family protein [bacterium]
MYHLYILKCSDKSLYTGITNDLDKRLASHEEGKGSKYVRSRLPFKLVHTERFRNRSNAQKREAKVKGWSRKEKFENLKLGI